MPLVKNRFFEIKLKIEKFYINNYNRELRGMFKACFNLQMSTSLIIPGYWPLIF